MKDFLEKNPDIDYSSFRNVFAFEFPNWAIYRTFLKTNSDYKFVKIRTLVREIIRSDIDKFLAKQNKCFEKSYFNKAKIK